MSSIENRYRNDNTFRTIVDQMRALLGVYHITPSELREASMLAASMHEVENVRPLLYPKIGQFNKFYEPPAMFGGAQTERTDSSKPNVSNTPQEIK